MTEPKILYLTNRNDNVDSVAILKRRKFNPQLLDFSQIKMCTSKYQHRYVDSDWSGLTLYNIVDFFKQFDAVYMDDMFMICDFKNAHNK